MRLLRPHIYDLASAKTRPVQVPARESDDQTDAFDDYLPRIAWTPANTLCLTRMNRHQNQVQLLLADPATGKTSLLLEEKSAYYLDLGEPVFLSDQSGFLWQSEKSGYNHLYKYNMKGEEVTAAD